MKSSSSPLTSVMVPVTGLFGRITKPSGCVGADELKGVAEMLSGALTSWRHDSRAFVVGGECRCLALFGPRAMSDLSLQCASKRTFAATSELLMDRTLRRGALGATMRWV
jgi:hypothetical protein